MVAVGFIHLSSHSQGRVRLVCRQTGMYLAVRYILFLGLLAARV